MKFKKVIVVLHLLPREKVLDWKSGSSRLTTANTHQVTPSDNT